jgi:starch phosphorylase
VQVVNWQRALEQQWSALRFGETQVATDGGQHVFDVQVYLDDLEPQAVRVEPYADGADGSAPLRVEMQRIWQLVGAANGFACRATVPATRPASHYTARIIPHHDGVAIPLEAVHIPWQR